MFIFINFVQKSNCSFLVMALGNLGNLKCISGKSFCAQKLLPEMVHGTIYRGRLQLKNQSVTIPTYPKCHFTQCVKFKQLRVGSGFCLIITDFGEGDNKGSLQNPLKKRGFVRQTDVSTLIYKGINPTFVVNLFFGYFFRLS